MNPGKKIRLILSATMTSVLVALFGCASVGNPDGGAYDDIPPRIVSTTPRENQTGVKRNKITIEFDEFIKIENASQKVIISPPQIEQPEIKVSGKKIQIELFDSLRENTTYSIDFSDGIVDNNEGNPLGNYCFRFSTGENTDTMEISGYVLNAQDLEPISGIMVGVYSDLSDSAFTTKPFDFISKTDATGHFTIRGLAEGKYRVYAVRDMDQTFNFSQRNELIAWIDSPVVTSCERTTRRDTIWTYEETVDTVLEVSYTRFTPDELVLLAFVPKPNMQYRKTASRPSHEKVILSFALPLDSMPEIRGLNFDETDAYIVEHTERYDSLTLWMKDTTIYYQDTLKFTVTYLASDSTGTLSPVTDTLALSPRRSHERIMRDQARRQEDEAKELEKRRRQLERNGDSLALAKLLAPKITYLDADLKSGRSLNIGDPITLTFKEPVTFLSDSAINVEIKVDTLWEPAPFVVEHDSVNIMNYTILAEWRPEEHYRISIDSASIQGIYGNINDNIEEEIQFAKLETFGALTVNVSNAKPSYIAQILGKSGTVVRSGKIVNGIADFFLLTPGDYYVRLFDDINGNGEWDKGEWDEKRQPEPVYYISHKYTIKADWYDDTEDWDITEIPVFKQKPQALTSGSAKSKSKKDVHKQNVEREQKKAQEAAKQAKKKENNRAKFRRQ